MDFEGVLCSLGWGEWGRHEKHEIYAAAFGGHFL